LIIVIQYIKYRRFSTADIGRPIAQGRARLYA